MSRNQVSVVAMVFLFAIFLSPPMVCATEQTTTTVVDISGLTPEQRRAVETVAAQMKEKKSDAPAIIQALQDIDKDKLRGWAEAGSEAGKAVANFAKEVGIVAGEFLDSFVGKAVFVLVFMNYGGGKILQFGVDLALFTALTPIFLFFMWKVYQRFVLGVIVIKDVKYNPNPFARLLGFNEETKRIEKASGIKDSDGDDWIVVIGWVLIVVCTILYFWNMWPKW